MADEQQPRDLTVREAGRLGGIATAQRYGRGRFADIGRAGGTQTKRRYGPLYYQHIGRQGGLATRDKANGHADTPTPN